VLPKKEGSFALIVLLYNLKNRQKAQMTWKIQVTKVRPYRPKRKKFLKSGFKQLTRWKHLALRPTSIGCQMPAASTMLLTYSWIALCCRGLITSWRDLLIEYPMPSRVRWAQMSWLMYSRTISRCLATRILQSGNKAAVCSWPTGLTKNNNTAKSTAFHA